MTKNTTLGNSLQLNDPIALSNPHKQVVGTSTPASKAKNGFSIEQILAKALTPRRTGNWTETQRGNSGASEQPKPNWIWAC